MINFMGSHTIRTKFAPTLAVALGAMLAPTAAGADLSGCRVFNSELKLQILHSSDHESSFQDPNTLEPKVLHYATLYDGLKRFGASRGFRTLHLTAGDQTLPRPFYQAAAEVEEYGSPGIADVEIFNALHLDANAIGNHEFDGGIDEFAAMLARAEYPYIGVNMDFSSVMLAEGTPPILVGTDGDNLATNGASVIKYGVRRVRGQCIGIIGHAPTDFFNVVEGPDTRLPGLDFVGGRDPETNQPLVSAIDLVLGAVDTFKAAGVNKIVLLDHAQVFSGDPLDAEKLRGIDIVIVAGATGFLAKPISDGPFNLLRPGDVSSPGVYPAVRIDSEGNRTLIVNSDNQYRYIGNLMVRFNRSGVVNPTTDVDPRSGPVATIEAAITLLDRLVPGPALAPPPAVLDIYETLQATDSIKRLQEIVGMTSYPLNGGRAEVRARETNLGRVVADSTLVRTRELFPSIAIDAALKNSGGIRDTIAGPAITRFALETALAFDNLIPVVELTVPQMIAMMENGVSRVAAFGEPPIGDGRFPQIAGMMMRFDASRPALEGVEGVTTPSRVERLVVTRADGSVETLVEDYVMVGDPSRTFVVATNQFLLTGGDDYTAFGAGVLLDETEIGEKQILEDYIAQQPGATISVVDPPPGPRIVQLH